MIWKGKKRHKPSSFLDLPPADRPARQPTLPRCSRSSIPLELMPFDCPRWPPDWPEIESALAQILQSGDWGRYHSSVGTTLRKRLTETFGVSDARLCCSGSAALEIALRAMKIGPGDEVIVAAYDYPASFRTVEILGARPVLADLAPESTALDADRIVEAASDQVRAVVASHLYGMPAPIQRLRQICDDRDWVLIEDACQVPGMIIGESMAGSLGHLATLSFGGSKLISAGNGGALLVGGDRSAKIDRITARLGGLLERPGDTFPLSPLQATVIEPQLDCLEKWNRVRNETARFLRRIADSRLPRWRWLGDVQSHVTPAYYKVAWLSESDEHRRRIIDRSEREGVPIGAGFRTMSRCSQRRCRKPVPTPLADQLSETLFVLDHRALLLEPTRHEALAESLIKIHNEST